MSKDFEKAYEEFRLAHVNASFMPKEMAKAMWDAATALGVDCCSNKNAIKCDQPQPFKNAASKYNLKFEETLAPTFDKAVSIIKSGSAVIIVHANRGGSVDPSTHAIVGFRTYKVNGRDHIDAYDPMTGKHKYLNSDWVVGNLAWKQLAWIK